MASVTFQPVTCKQPASDIYSHPEFLTVLYRTADCAKNKMPDAEARILRASMLVMNGHVHADTLIPQAWIVDSESQAGVAYQVIDNVCTCESYTRHQGTPDGLWYCKHVLSVFLYRRVAQHLAWLPSATAACFTPVDIDGVPCQAVAEVCTHQTPRIPPQFVVELHGKQFVQYAGLLAMAHEQGLVQLEATFISVTDSLAVAQATATFTDGRKFTESGDATPANVSRQVAPHFARMALTRSKARCLRDALNVGMCSIEELE